MELCCQATIAFLELLQEALRLCLCQFLFYDLEASLRSSLLLPPSLCLRSIHPFTFSLLLPSSVPASQRMKGDVVGFELAVGVEQQAPQVAPDLRLPAFERTQEQTSGVVVVGVQVVPDERRSLEDRLHLSQAVHRQLLGDDLTA